MKIAIAGLLAVGATVAVTGAPAQAVAGNPAADGSYRFTARLEVGDLRACTGVLIDESWILSASSCFAAADGTPAVPGAPKVPVTVTIGAKDTSGTDGVVTTVEKIIPRSDRNLIVAKLATKVAGIVPARLASTPPASGDALRVAGYGRTKDEWVPDKVHTAAAAVGTVDETTFAISGSDPDGATTCRGDAGGPALRESNGVAEVAGLHSTSWQNGCLGSTETRTGATEVRVDNLTMWIRQQILDAQPAADPVAAGALLRAWNSDLCLNVPGRSNDNVGLVQYPCNGTAQQTNEQWTGSPVGDGTFRVVAANSHKCLNVPGNKPDENLQLLQYTCGTDSLNDRWRPVPVAGANRFQLLNMKTGKCAAIKDASTASGAQVVQLTCKAGAANMEWYTPPTTKTPVPVALGSSPITTSVGRDLSTTSGIWGRLSFTDSAGRVLYGTSNNLADMTAFRWNMVSGTTRFAGQPSLTTVEGRPQLSARNLDGDIWLVRSGTSTGNDWEENWTDMGGGASGAAVAVNSTVDDSAYHFDVGSDGALWVAVQPTGSIPFLGWRKLGGTGLTGVPTVVNDAFGLRVFVLDRSGAVQVATFAQNALSSWKSLGGSGITGRIAVVPGPAGSNIRSQVAVRTTDGKILTKVETSSGLHPGFPDGWTRLGDFVSAGDPSLVVRSPGQGSVARTVAARGTDGHVYLSNGDPAAAWTPVADVTAKSDPTVQKFLVGNVERVALSFQLDANKVYLAFGPGTYEQVQLPDVPQ